MKFACKSVFRGWQTILSFEEQPEMEYPVGPVFSKCSDLWDWQQRNLPAPLPCSASQQDAAVAQH